MTTIRLDKFPGRQFTHSDREYLYFGGTAYLGLQTHPDFQERLANNIRKYGSNFGASRLGNVILGVYDEAEIKLSQWVGSEAALTMSSGYLAGQSIVNYLDSDRYQFFYGPNTHSALLLKGHQSYQDFESLRKSLVEHLEKNPEQTPVILIDTIDLPVSNYPDFEELKNLPLSECILIADDSHGIGIVGEQGSGCYRSLLSLNPKELIVCASLGKAMAIPAGVVFGTAKLIGELKKTNIFAGASPPPPAYLATFIESFPLYKHQLSHLLDLIQHFRNTLKYPDKFAQLEEYPVFFYNDIDLADFLLQSGFCTTNFNYPAEKYSWQSRIVLNASHYKEDVQKLAKTVNRFHQ